MSRLRQLAAALVWGAVLASGVPLSAQTVTGVLLARGTDQPVDLGLVALVDLAGDSIDADITDAEGRFALEAPTGGEYRLQATALGFRPTVTGSVLELPEGSSSRATASTPSFRCLPCTPSRSIGRAPGPPSSSTARKTGAA